MQDLFKMGVSPVVLREGAEIRASRLMIVATAMVVLVSAASGMGGREGSAVANGGDGRLAVVVSILPQSYFVQRIAGDRVKTTVLVGPGQSPHSYEPSPRQMADLANADVWFSIGVEFEKALEPKVRSMYPMLPIIDTTVGIEFRSLEAQHHEGETAQDHEHDAGGTDPHTWLGRTAVRTMAASMRDTLARIDPAGAMEYKANCDAFVRDIDAAFDALAQDLRPLHGKAVFVYHPAFGYFLDEFGIIQEAVETGGKEPTQKALAELIHEAREDGARVIFVQAQFPASAAKTVADAIGGVVVQMDPLAPDWLDNIRRMGDAVRHAIP